MQKVDTTEILKKSIIVVAHPDDEVLWFNSIVDKVDEVVMCFLECKSNPHWKTGRQKSLMEHPIRKISCLNIDEAEVFNGADWKNPVITHYGLKISRRKFSDKRYRENYDKLRQLLKNKLIDYPTVFTHNPWGEYGNEEHVQIYRVVKELQREMKFQMLFSNYASNKSLNLMQQYILGLEFEYITFRTNKALGDCIKDIYRRNNCWTWYDDWGWHSEESFIKNRTYEEKIENYGHMFPANVIKVKPPVEAKRRFKVFPWQAMNV